MLLFTHIYTRVHMLHLGQSLNIKIYHFSTEEVSGIQMGAPTLAEHTHNVIYLSPMNVVQVESLKLSLVSYMNVLTLRQFLGCYNFSLSCENSSALCK